MTSYRVKGWERFQHYKDRKPPWIKLQRDLLDDYEFHCLPVASRALAPMLWLLASENEDVSSGVVEGPDERIAFRLHQGVKDFQAALKPLIEKGFVRLEHDASDLLAACEHPAIPETEKEAEGERNKPRGKRRVSLDELSVGHVSDWLAKKRAEGRYGRHDEHFVLEYFKNYCQSKGKRYDDYVAGYRQAFEWDRCQPKLPGGTGVQAPGHRPAGQPTKSDRLKAAAAQARADLGLQP
ncbi:MAG: hypothetical protein BGO49_24555 [Planctomycetales bacterium 71-10]|nr:MAG: hypothetical protein BGO49_24555 [Planctomycetales bacterium 71-10]